MPCFLPCLSKLKIKCENLAFSLPRIPHVQELEPANCENQQQVESFFEALKQMETSPRNLCLSDCSSVTSVGCLPTTLKKLEISSCKKFEFPSYHLHESFQVLSIYSSCDSFTILHLDSFPHLKRLLICGPESLESLSMSDELCQDLKFLSSVTISKCPCFVSFPKGGLRAPNPTHICFVGCKKLKSLPEKMHNLLPSLEVLRIEHCSEIESFPKGGLPCSLSTLVSACCHKLIATRSNWNLQRLPNLTHFTRFEEMKLWSPSQKRGYCLPLLPIFQSRHFQVLKLWTKMGFNNSIP